MDMNQYLEIFIEESKEHLQSLNQSLLQLEKNPGDSPMINEIFRVAHTLKGMSATMGFNKMAKLTHDMEDVLHSIRIGETSITTNMLDVLFKCLDALENYVNYIVDTGNEGSNDYADIINALGAIAKGGGQNEKTQTASAPAAADEKSNAALKTSDFILNQYEQNLVNKAYEINMNALKITVILNKGCLLKSARAFIIFQALERHSEIIKSQPKVEDIEDEKFDNEFTVVVVTKEEPEIFSNELNSIAEVEKVIISKVESGPIEGTAAKKQEQAAVKELAVSNEHEDTEEEAAAKASNAIKKQKTGKTVRVDIDRLDVLLNLVSELIIQKTRLEGLELAEKSQTFTETVEYLERITTNLHDAVMKVRMVPVETVFNRFPRMIRDISRELGKEVDLKMSGEETELDRTVIDEIGDPLIHLLRNSVDHGIESVEMRKAAGKPEVGQIWLKAYQDGTNVIIEVQDDGKGLDLEKTKKKAVEKGIISKDIVNSLSKKDIIDLLFRPSFSTADKVTDLSGRGVGLDVVKTKIEQLGGMVEVETEFKAGTRFIIRLPLTLAIIQALLVMVGNEKYALQLSSINNIINISPEDIKLVQKQEVILLRNTVIPIVRLDKVLEVPRDEVTSSKQHTVVIVKKGDRLSGFLVDSIIGQQEIVQKSLGKFFAGNKTITSATILGDGNVALILDVNTLA